MKLTWLGHSCFLMESADGSLVFDPYAPGSVPGLRLPKLKADAVHCSHEHRDHGYARGVKLTGKPASFTLTEIPCWHDEQGGALRGPNRIAVVEAEGLRIAHLGDLGHLLSEEQLAALGKIDLLMIPVGGHYTIDAATARRQAAAIGARLVLPMHYRGPGFGYDVIGPVEDFLAPEDRVLRLEDTVLDPAAVEGQAVVLLRCPTEA